MAPTGQNRTIPSDDPRQAAGDVHRFDERDSPGPGRCTPERILLVDRPGLALAAQEAHQNLSVLLRNPLLGSVVSQRKFFTGTVLSFQETGYAAIGREWIGTLGWGGASFWLANLKCSIYIGFVSDNPARGTNATQSILVNAIRRSLGDMGEAEFWSHIDAVG